MKEFEIDGQQYRVEQVDAFLQLQVARRLMPLQIAMGLSFSKIGAAMQADDAKVIEFLGGPIAEFVSKMPHEDFEFITHTAAGAAKRQQGDRWAPVMVAGRLMFQDIAMKVLLRIIVEFVKENTGDFFAGLAGPQS